MKCDQWSIGHVVQYRKCISNLIFHKMMHQSRERMCKSVDCHYNWFQLFNPWGAGRKGGPVFQESISHKLYNRVYIHVHITCHYKYRPSGWSVAYQFPTYYKDHFTPAWAALLTACLVIVDIIGQPPDLRHHRQLTHKKRYWPLSWAKSPLFKCVWPSVARFHIQLWVWPVPDRKSWAPIVHDRTSHGTWFDVTNAAHGWISLIVIVNISPI